MSTTASYQLITITDYEDPRFWTLLFQLLQDFPLAECIPPGDLATACRTGRLYDRPTEVLALAMDGDTPDSIYGIAVCQEMQEQGAIYLMYLSVRHDARSQGLGATILEKLIARIAIAAPWARALVLEAEDPDHAPNEQASAIAARRLSFYRRNGFRFATDLTYWQPVGIPTNHAHYESPERVRLLLGIRSLDGTLTDQEANLILTAAFSERIERALDSFVLE